MANFTIASTPRTFDRQSNEWKDGETLFLRASVWREAAENVAESLTKGMRVIVSGRLKSRSYETKEGEKRTVIELEVDEIGRPAVRERQGQPHPAQQPGRTGTAAASATRATATGQPSQPRRMTRGPPRDQPAAGGWGNGPDSEPPF